MLDSADVGSLVLGRYRIVRRLASGGMGDLYLARTEGAAGFVRPVVIKQVRRDLERDPSAIRMFEREARINARLQHPHIVDVLDFREERGAYLMVLEYVNGLALSAWLRLYRDRDQPVPAAVAHLVGEPVLDALSAVHGLVDASGHPTPVIHRDVSPSNLLLDARGCVKLMDFGIARLLEPDDPDDYATGTHALKGKIAYLSPEVLEGRPPTTASDVFALGVVLHEMLAGRNEFRASQMAEALTRILSHELTPLEDLRPDLPPALGRVIARATAKDPGDRWASADAFLEALRATRAAPFETVAAEARARLAADLDAPEMSDLLGDRHPTELDRTWRDFAGAGDDVPDLQFEDEAGAPGAASGREASTELAAAARSREASEPWADTALALETVAEQTARLQPRAPRHPARPPDDGAALELDWGAGARADQAEDHARSPRRRRRWIVGGLGAVALLGAAVAGAPGLGGWLDSGAGRPPPPPAVVARGRGEVAPDEARTRPGAARSTPPPEVHFEKQQRLFEPCVARHGVPPRDLRDVRFELDIDPSGRVRRAALAPFELGRTPLGRCLRRVARKLRFSAGQGGRFAIMVAIRP